MVPRKLFLCLLLRQLLPFRLLIPFVEKHKSENLATYFVRQQAAVAGFEESINKIPAYLMRSSDVAAANNCLFLSLYSKLPSTSGVCCMPVTVRSLSTKFGSCILKTLSCSSRLPALYVTTFVYVSALTF